MDKIHYKRKINELSLLFELSQILDKTPDLEKSLNPVLQLIANHMGMQRGTISLINRQNNKLSIVAAYNLSNKEIDRGQYELGEGITGKVALSGQAMVIPNIFKEPTFLNKTQSRKGQNKTEISFICVPVKMDNMVLGTLSVDRIATPDISLDEDVQLLTIIASLIAQASRLRQQINEKKALLEEENKRLQNELKEMFKPSSIIGSSSAMREVFTLINQVCKSDATVLIQGESGTGKELVAQEIHYNSNRANKPFIKVNCSALPESIIESELFGHEKGSFTGATSMRKGRFEMADGGTIFLDEIGELSQTVQVKLLRVIQEREIERIGSGLPIQVNIRFLTATNRNLMDEVKKGNFREDLYYRLNVYPITIPPLRKRKSDIMLLADHFTEKYSKRNDKFVKRISSSTINLFTSYHWPGNVRELENCIERAVLLSTDGVIHAYHLPPSLQSAESTDTSIKSSLPLELEKIEKEMILDALKTTGGTMSSAAHILGITERQMGCRVKKYNIDFHQFRN